MIPPDYPTNINDSTGTYTGTIGPCSTQKTPELPRGISAMEAFRRCVEALESVDREEWGEPTDRVLKALCALYGVVVTP